jgi:membrane associated rhomboid family serine protease
MAIGARLGYQSVAMYQPPAPPQPTGPLTRTPEGGFVYENLRPRFRPLATWALTGAIVVAFLIQSSVPGLTERFDVDPAAVRTGEWWRIVTGAFLHGGLLHLAANAYFGWSIGARIERFIGPWRLLAVSAVAMVGSGLAVTYFSRGPVLGFSGVLFGWLASWLAFHLTPRFPGLRLSGPMRTAYLQLLIANLAISLLPGISAMGHLGGFIGGFAAAFLLGLKATRAATRVG